MTEHPGSLFSQDQLTFLIYFFTFFYFILIHDQNIVNCGIEINNVMVVSGEQRRDSAVDTHVPLLP